MDFNEERIKLSLTEEVSGYLPQKDYLNSSAENNLEELDWNPKEIVLKAGGVFFYDGQVIHSASDNMTQQPRLVCLYNFTQKGNREKEVNARQTIHERFNSEHLKKMDDQMKQLVGLV